VVFQRGGAHGRAPGSPAQAMLAHPDLDKLGHLIGNLARSQLVD
jgi:hypothetical protein